MTSISHVYPFARAAVFALALVPVCSQADCIDDAARARGVKPLLLRAIGWHVSGLNPTRFGQNKHGSKDFGAFQTNSAHLSRWQAYGITLPHLFDGCVSASLAAELLRDCVSRLGNTWEAVGCYHSPTPARRAWYANAIAAVLRQWGAVPPGPPPFNGVPLLAPTDASATSPRGRTGVMSRYAASSTVFDAGDVDSD